jgi:hypothetical protein
VPSIEDRHAHIAIVQYNKIDRLMTARGQNPNLPHRNTDARFTSISRPQQAGSLRRYVPLPDLSRCSKSPSLDHVVGANEQRGWEGNTERLGGLEIEDHLNFRDLLHR